MNVNPMCFCFFFSFLIKFNLMQTSISFVTSASAASCICSFNICNLKRKLTWRTVIHERKKTLCKKETDHVELFDIMDISASCRIVYA